MLTTPKRITPVRGTDISVITVKRCSCNTLVILKITGFCSGTHVIIAAVGILITLAAANRGIHTSGGWITGVISATVTVITYDRVAGFTVALRTVVTGCTHTPVITG